MKSTRLDSRLCITEGGGRFVDIPGFPGERVDRRLLRDIRMLKRRYKIFITDGHSTSGVHAPNGEHPIGLALDIVPNKAAGGSWRDITQLAHWAEPRQNDPRQPFRWVGYDGDAGHGRGHHLHLSWSHSPTKPKRPAGTVYTVRCPDRKNGGDSAGDGNGGGGKTDRPDSEQTDKPDETSGDTDRPKRTDPDGGTNAGDPPTGSSNGGTNAGDPPPSSGGVSPRRAPAVRELDGASS